MSERDWIAGNRAAWRRVLGEAIRELSGDNRDRKIDAARMLLEIDDARRALRRLCEELGIDADWDDKLYLADAIEKRIGRELIDRAKR